MKCATVESRVDQPAAKDIQPHIFVIMGVLGDLTRRKLLPAVYHLSSSEQFGKSHIFLGVDIDPQMTDAGFRQWAHEALEAGGLCLDCDQIKYWCDCRLHYQSIGEGAEKDYGQLAGRIKALQQEHALGGNQVFYLALPLENVTEAIDGLGGAKLNEGQGWTRLVVEKPFGRDLASARELNSHIHHYFEEKQVYRIDHYLGKEAVQNLMVLRFANAFFEHLWNREHVESIQITVAETLGIERRARYYDRAGALRDMVQNHLTQLLCLVAMEIPASFQARDIRYEKLKVLRQILPIEPDNVILGQYRGYHDEPGVAPDSATETFAAMKLGISNWRWEGVPFYLRVGKKLPMRRSQIAIRFERAPLSIFQPFENTCDVKNNTLVIALQPDEGVSLKFQVKSIGDPMMLTTQQLSFRYADAFGPLPDAYEHLIGDIVAGDPSLFICDNGVETSWRLYDSLIGDKPPIHPYEPGSWGPPEVEKIGALWHNPEVRVA